jgi:photosystem II stability/assembly factor-like uncharacterized protein
MFIEPAPPAGHPAAIAFWDLQRGLFARGSTVLLTADGGRTFRRVLKAPHKITGLQAFGSREAIVDLNRPAALRTLDGGHSWAPFRYSYNADFATPQVALGFRTGRFEFVEDLRLTRDGGASWQRRNSPCTRAIANSVATELVTPRIGWIVCTGQPGAGQQPKAVYRTADAGRTWRRAKGRLSWSGYAWGTAFGRDGFGLVWESRGTLYVTRDGGDHWSAKPRLARPEIDFGGGGAAFAGGRGLVLLSRGAGAARLLATRDYGRTWRVVHRWR